MDFDIPSSSNNDQLCYIEDLKEKDIENANELKFPDLDDFELSFDDLKSNSQIVKHTSMEKTTPDEAKSSCNRHKQLRNPNRRRHKKGQLKRSFVPKQRHVIQHNYHDHANDVIDFDEYTGECIGLDVPLKKKGGVAIPFPLKLHDLLEKVDEEGHQHIVSWQPHGRAFVVREPKIFVMDLMPRFFRQTKLTSFQRQLNLYGFSRLTRGPDAGGYYHELFLRGKPYLTRRMVRTKIKGTGYKAASNPACEPNFYNMTSLGQECVDANSNGETRHSSGDPVHRNGGSTSIPVITPTLTSPTYSQTQICSTPSDMSIMSITEMPSMKSEMPFLKPKPHSRAVQMGNEHFHYMESMNHPSNEEYCSRSSCTPSPVFFERMSSEDTSVKDSDEDPSQDPLSIFLADMGEDFQDDIVFSCDSVQEENDHNKPVIFPTNFPIYEV
jgi:hypothetical protein